MEPFKFAPPKPVAKTGKNREKTYTCCICGAKDVPAKDMYYAGQFMAEYRDPVEYACKFHSSQE